MTEKEFFESIAYITSSEIYLTEKLDELVDEMSNNNCYVNIELETINNVSNNKLINFIEKVILNRQLQLISSNKKISLIFYLWIDDLSGNLHFNFINSKHKQLPFNCKLKYVDSIHSIVNCFLDIDYQKKIKSKSVDEILTDFDNDEYLDIYTRIIGE